MVSIRTPTLTCVLFLVLCGCVSYAYDTIDFDFKKCGAVVVDKEGAIVTVENKDKSDACKLEFTPKQGQGAVTLLIEELDMKCDGGAKIEVVATKKQETCGKWNVESVGDVKVGDKERNLFNETDAGKNVTMEIVQGKDFTRMRVLANIVRRAETCDSDFTCTTKGKSQSCINAGLKCNGHYDCADKFGADEESCGLGTVAIVGIIVGVIAGILIIGGAVYVFILKKK